MDNIKNFPAEITAEEGSSASFHIGDEIQMRELRASELMLMVRIIGKIGLKEFSTILKEDGIKDLIFEKLENKENGEFTADDFLTVGADVVLGLIETITRHIPVCEKEIYQLLSNLTGKTPQEISELRIDVFTQLLLNIFKKPEFGSFFTVASSFVK